MMAKQDNKAVAITAGKKCTHKFLTIYTNTQRDREKETNCIIQMECERYANRSDGKETRDTATKIIYIIFSLRENM